MRFSDNVVMYQFAGTPIIGNPSTGYSIGLSAQGEELCRALLSGSISSEQLRLDNNDLYDHLVAGKYFQQTEVVNSLESAYLHVTQRCNLNCVGCYSLDNARNTTQDASLEQLKCAVSELSIAGINSLIISGGEPFLYNHLTELLEFAKIECKIPDICLATNGLFITKDNALVIKPFVDKISVSIDGCNNDSKPYIRRDQNFDTLMERIMILKELSIPVQITPTIHAKNKDEMEEYVALALSLDVALNYSLFSCAPEDDSIKELIPDNRDLEILGMKIFYQSGNCTPTISNGSLGMSMITKSSCGAAKKTLSIAADGSVYPCHMLQCPDLLMGNVFCESITNILERQESTKLRARFTDLNENCLACEFRWLCAGGCKARSYLTFNSFIEMDPYCPIYSTFYTCFSNQLKQSFGKEV